MRTAQGLVFLLVSVCCDTHSPRLGVLAGVSVLWYVQPKIWWSFWCQCVVIRTAQDLVVFLVSVCCDTYSPRLGGLAGVSVLWCVQLKSRPRTRKWKASIKRMLMVIGHLSCMWFSSNFYPFLWLDTKNRSKTYISCRKKHKHTFARARVHTYTHTYTHTNACTHAHTHTHCSVWTEQEGTQPFFHLHFN